VQEEVKEDKYSDMIWHFVMKKDVKVLRNVQEDMKKVREGVIG